MPAFRSSDEAEIRDAVVARLREGRPGSRIIHEINVAGTGSNRIDVLAVGTSEILAVEIKSKKDKLSRLPLQVAAMTACAHRAYVALHERFLVETVTNKWAAWSERDGVYYRRDVPEEYRRLPGGGVPPIEYWIFPKMCRALSPGPFDSGSWRLETPALQDSLPAAALDMLWRSELLELCGELRVSTGRAATMIDMRRDLRWFCAGRELTVGVCDVLRRRRCAEADHEILKA